MPIAALSRMLAALSLLFACASALSEKPVSLIVDFDASNPPLMYQDQQGVAGLYPLLVSTICHRAGIAAVQRAVSWREALQELGAGRAAAGGIIKTVNREVLFDFSQPLFYESVVMAYAAPGKGYRKLEDLDGKRVGVIAGWSYGNAFDRARRQGRFAALDGDSDQQNLRQLRLGRLDVVLGIREALQLAIQENAYRDLPLSHEALVTNPSFLAINKTSPQAALLRRFNHALHAMRQDGSYDRLVNGYLAKTQAAR
ncbi:ABC transporter substrate-binding protein [Chromobacterium sp. IIBBL 290-4]|uniref:substrate-binding periplasmic protein n=1 Tax=Chromobacterium sp. IIBBL 290-4 TaxID=2953890 RepID=UPI0020B6FA19|nr:transporter substrate-binding domain-containing protein [Chromobacterium sp. IIBBL 290-4]UTH75921.1 transporter substrate-binding domain-containing protein [Chromobacterium sp. IIBBL 290-4]